MSFWIRGEPSWIYKKARSGVSVGAPLPYPFYLAFHFSWVQHIYMPCTWVPSNIILLSHKKFIKENSSITQPI